MSGRSRQWIGLGLILLLTQVGCAPETAGITVPPTHTATPPSASPSAAGPAATPSPLERVEWSLLSLDGAEPIPGTEIRLEFYAGMLSGSAGCNRLVADYWFTSALLGIESLTFTEMACAEPEGVLEQEDRILAILAEVTRYYLIQGELWLVTDDGRELIFVDAAALPADTPSPTALPAVEIEPEVDLEPPPARPEVTAEPSPTRPVEVHGPETRTGIPELDEIIRIVLVGDTEGLRRLISTSKIGCTHALGLGGPPKCQEGEEEGTAVEVLPILGPEGHHMRREELEGWPGVEVVGLYAAYEVGEGAYSDPNYPAGVYAIVFVAGSGRPALVLQVTEGRLVRIDNEFGPSLRERMEREAAAIILPPP